MMWKWPILALILGHLFSTAHGVPGAMYTSSKPSGVLCGPQTRCVTGATCVSGKCRCPQGTFGDGAFNCYLFSDFRAEVQGSGNRLTTFQNTSANFVWPCRFRFLEVKTIRTSNQKECHVQIFGINKVIGGRVALAGMEVHANIQTADLDEDGIGILNKGISKNGLFTYQEWGKINFDLESPVSEAESIVHRRDDMDVDASGSGAFAGDQDDGPVRKRDLETWGPPEEIVSNENSIASEMDQDNFANIEVADCGVRARFRAPDVNPEQQVQVSGLSVAISSNNGHISHEQANTYVAESPIERTLTFQPVVRELIPDQDALHWLHTVLIYSAQQENTPEGNECDETGQIYRSYCDSTASRFKALNTCSFFLEKPELVKCLDRPDVTGPPTNSINAFKLCIWHVCQPSRYVCGLLKMRIQNFNCMSMTPDYFVNLSCDT